MKKIDIIDFPKFYRSWIDDINARNLTGDRYLRACGYKSTIYNTATHIWEMSDSDYTMFILKWG